MFENNNEDYDRVMSQLTTMDSFEEISDFIENIIKPDYNNWDGKEDYETRFLETISKIYSLAKQVAVSERFFGAQILFPYLVSKYVPKKYVTDIQ